MQVCTLTNEYYHLVPQEGFVYERVEPISTKAKVSQCSKVISTLLDLELSAKMVAGAQYRAKGRVQ